MIFQHFSTLSYTSHPPKGTKGRTGQNTFGSLKCLFTLVILRYSSACCCSVCAETDALPGCASVHGRKMQEAVFAALSSVYIHLYLHLVEGGEEAVSCPKQ